jgi:DNA-binding response OmpR family regulator
MRGTPAHPAVHPVILVVEDAASVRQTIQQILEEAEFLVLLAENAEQALELAQSCASPVHLLITKLHPDGMLAPDLVLHLRKRSPEMMVLYSSANPLDALEIPDATEVISSMLPRPFSKSTLLNRINTLLAAHV